MFAKKFLSTLTVGIGLACGSFAASAALNPFCVNDSSLGGAGAFGSFTACAGAGSNVGTNGFAVDLLQGSYVEKLRVTSLTGPSSGTFAATILFNINTYSYLGSSVSTALDTPEGLSAAGYNLYALVQATGTFSGQSFSASSASLSVFGDADQDANMGFSAIDDATLAFIGGGAGDVLLGGSILLQSGSGSTAPAGGQDGFAVTFDKFALTAAGDGVFIAPRPFYVRVYSDGDITDPSFDPTVIGLTTLQGEASANFLLPEPGSLALVGLTLAGLGLARRRRT